MKNIKLGLIVLLFVSLFANVIAMTAQQESLDVAVIPEFNQPARVNLSISDVSPGNYNLYTLTAVKILPSTPFSLSSGKNILELYIYPTSELYANGPATYSFTYSIRNSDTDENTEQNMAVRVVSVLDAFVLSSDSNSADSENLVFYIKNKESIDLTNVKAKFSSPFFDVEQTFNVPANGKKEFSVALGNDKIKRIEAGSYLLKAEIQTDRGLKTLEGRIYIGEKKGVEVKDSSEGIIIRTNEYMRINYGNVKETVSISAERDVFSRLFTSFNVAPDVVNRDGLKVTYSWTRTLNPADSFDVKVRTNYSFPLVILIALVLIIVAIRRFTQTKLMITKSIVPVKTKSGHFALKIKLAVKAIRRIENVSLIDRIPGVVQIYEKFQSNVQPTKIDAKNRRIQWDLGGMAPGEERFFSYMVYSTVGVVGKFSLPQALAVFEKDGQIHEVDSNSVYFLAEQKAMDE